MYVKISAVDWNRPTTFTLSHSLLNFTSQLRVRGLAAIDDHFVNQHHTFNTLGIHHHTDTASETPRQATQPAWNVRPTPDAELLTVILHGQPDSTGLVFPLPLCGHAE